MPVARLSVEAAERGHDSSPGRVPAAQSPGRVAAGRGNFGIGDDFVAKGPLTPRAGHRKSPALRGGVAQLVRAEES